MKQEFDALITQIAEYAADAVIPSKEAYNTARLCLYDALACACLATVFPECQRLMGPVVGGEFMEEGVRVPATKYELNPVEAAFNISLLIRWLDYNDTWLAKEWGHPSDNLGAILAVGDYISRLRRDKGQPELLVGDILTAMIKAYEIQGILALENSFNSVGLDHVILVKMASTAVATAMAGGDKTTIANAISLAIVDGHPLRTYRHSPNTTSRKSWAAGDATSRAVWLAQLALRGEVGIPTALSAERWGFYDVYFKGKPFIINREFSSYVMENILFKVQFPAEFHGQTAIEAALKLYEQVKFKWDTIERIEIRTQEPALRIISKTGELNSRSDRDHCLQYMTALALVFGKVSAEHYDDHFARDPRIDDLRKKMQVTQDDTFTKDYYDPEKRSIANAIKIIFNDGTTTEEVVIEYPLGHRRRRKESLPALEAKFHRQFMTHFTPEAYTQLIALYQDQQALESTPVTNFMSLLVKP
jgi:2-methylcitrate dehydratase